MVDFIDDEILEMAIAREVDANRFYLALASRVQNRGIKRVFEKLAAEELEHKAALELEIMKTGRVVKDVEPRAGLGGRKRVYVPPKMKMNYKNIMKIGVKKEEAAIQFYADLAEMTSDSHSKEILLALAQEEAVHKQRFQKALDLLSHIA